MNIRQEQHRLMVGAAKCLHPQFRYETFLTGEELALGGALLLQLLEEHIPSENAKEALTESDKQWNRYLEELLGDIDAGAAAKLSSELQIVTSLARRHRQLGRIWSKERLIAAVRHLMSGNAEVSDSYLPVEKPSAGQTT